MVGQGQDGRRTLTQGDTPRFPFLLCVNKLSLWSPLLLVWLLSTTAWSFVPTQPTPCWKSPPVGAAFSVSVPVTNNDNGDFLSSSSSSRNKRNGNVKSPPPPPLDGSSSSPSLLAGSGRKVSLRRYLAGLVKEQPELRELESLLLSFSMACKTISNLIGRGNINQIGVSNPSSRSSMRTMDQLSAQALRNALRFTGQISTISIAKESLEPVMTSDDGPSEYQPGVLLAQVLPSNDTPSTSSSSASESKQQQKKTRYVAVFDPLDGSGNADASIVTGTIFGVFDTTSSEGEDDNGEDGFDVERAVLQPGKNLRAAGYCLYSSATIIVFSVGSNVVGATLDPQLGEFFMTHGAGDFGGAVRIPRRGSIYSCNEANAPQWTDPNVRRYLEDLKSNRRSLQPYTQRYVGSMVGDIHRLLLYGGIFFYPDDTGLHPRGNLQLLYKCAPLAFLVTKAGGVCTDGKMPLLEAVPERVHARSPCFMGSPDDMAEMMTYVQHREDCYPPRDEEQDSGTTVAGTDDMTTKAE